MVSQKQRGLREQRKRIEAIVAQYPDGADIQPIVDALNHDA